jgi:dienelactone hydrolase
MGRDGATHPVVLWGNGTGASPSSYSGLLQHFATHGFIVAAANTPNARTGQEMLAGLDYLTRANTTAGSVFEGKVDTSKVGSSGHSQGGAGAAETGADPRVDTVIVFQGSFAVKGSATTTALVLAGSQDAPERRYGAYTSTRIPAAFAELRGADHFVPVGNGGAFRGIATSWLYWQLRGDTAQSKLFVGPTCGLCNNPQWSRYERNAAFQALTSPVS